MELRNKLILLISIALFSACLPEEEPIDAKPRPGLNVVQVEMGSDYATQVWYDLSAQQVVSTNSRFIYDMIYNPNDSIVPVTLNSARISGIASLKTTDFSTIVEQPNNYTYVVSNPDGNADSNAFAKVNYQDGGVYLVKLGVTEEGRQAGYRKIRITENPNGYTMEHGAVNVTEPEILELPLLRAGEQQAIVFAENTLIDILPSAEEYDLVFTNYTHLFTEPFYASYSVTGVLVNPDIVQSTELLVDIPFDEITEAATQSVEWTYAYDELGYDWKAFSLETNSFTVDPDRHYIIKDRYGLDYKLRFIDFYNAQGEKGYPTFEVEPL